LRACKEGNKGVRSHTNGGDAMRHRRRRYVSPGYIIIAERKTFVFSHPISYL
jgi:hypothetical protein